MKKVTAFVGSARKGSTLEAVHRLKDLLEADGGMECEIVVLADYRLGTCKGCKVCFEKGEEFCPLRDDRDSLIGKIEASDGIVLASPNYMFQVSGLMKTFLDRMAFLAHRPRFHGKAFAAIVCQGFFGGGKILKYLDFVGKALGFDTVKGARLATLEPVTEKARRNNEAALAGLGRRFGALLTKPEFRAPDLLRLMVFRASRTSMRHMLDGRSRDWRYYSEKGWFESDYYYPTRLGALKKAAGALLDSAVALAASGRGN
jgi:multimeric flavodoxin WrbA